MQVFSEPEGGLGGERRGSGVSVGMGDTSQDNTYATIQHPLPTNRHRPTTPDYTTLPGNHNVSRVYLMNNAIARPHYTDRLITLISNSLSLSEIIVLVVIEAS